MGIFYKRINATGAFVTLITGLVIGAVRIFLEIKKDSFDPDGFLYLVGGSNFLSFGAWFFLFCIILIVVISHLTSPPAMEKVENLTFQTISAEEKRENRNSYNWKDIVISIIILVIVAAVMIFFNGA